MSPGEPLAEDSTRRMVVLDVRRKFEHLANYLGLGRTVTALADGLGIPRRTIGDAATEGGCTKVLHEQLKTAIAKLGKKFDPDWIEWRDPDPNASIPRHQRSDTLERFKERLRRENGTRQPVGGIVGPEHATGQATSADDIEVELTIDRPFAEFSEEEQVHFLEALSVLLKIGRKLRISRKAPGSVKLTLYLKSNEFFQLGKLFERGKLKDLKVVDIRSTALVPYTPTKGATIRARLAERKRIAETFVEQAPLGYAQLRAGPALATASDKIADLNLIDDSNPATRALLDELVEQSSHYFEFKTDLFKFHARRDRGIWSILRSPQSYADLEEENIEEKFPDDMQSRALMCGFNNVIKQNHLRRMFKETEFQIGFTLPAVPLFLWWPVIVSYLAAQIPESLVQFLPGQFDRSLIATALLICFAASYIAAAHLVVRHQLNIMGEVFRMVNSASCQVLANHMVIINGTVRRIYNKLLVTDIEISESRRDSIQRADWPLKVEKVFKLALWQAKRIEYLERFWQIQLERLRLFELATEAARNVRSRLIAVLVILVSILVGGALGGVFNIIHIGAAIMIFASWHLGRLARARAHSFDVGDIVKEGFESKWSPFKTLAYYDGIARQYRASKEEVRINKLRDALGGGPSSGPQAH